MINLERALRYELNKIPEINNKIYPTNAPEGKEPPYLVYILSRYKELKSLDGFENSIEASYLLNILAKSYDEMKGLTKKVRETILTFLQREIGINGIYISDLSINNVSEIYEHELKLYRGIIDVTFYYEGV